MAFNGLLITEIFHSLQGETSLTGVPFAFIRLTGCNLRCSYCDSTYSFKGGKRMSFEEVLAQIEPYRVKHVLMTGGEPLLQRGTLPFIELLKSKGYIVSIETHGEAPIKEAAKIARIVMDVKTPGSNMSRGMYHDNFKYLKPSDEVKFVITSKSDYEWARGMVQRKEIPVPEILFSPAMRSEFRVSDYEGVNPKDLADWILKDKLPVRFQLQLHKVLWGLDTKGV